MTQQSNSETESMKRIVIGTLDSQMVEALKKKLGKGNYKFYVVQRGIDVLVKILDHNIDLLIMDIDLAGIMGVEVLPVVKRLRPRLPVILITDDFNHRIRKVAAELGINYQAFKPISTSETDAIVSATETIIERNLTPAPVF